MGDKKTIQQQQLEICKEHDVLPNLPDKEQLVVISDGVFEGEPLEGVRYPSPSHMSGWWLTTDKYNGDSNSLRTEHFYHILEKRPDIAQFLALPVGYRFRYGRGEDVWFDEIVAKAD